MRARRNSSQTISTRLLGGAIGFAALTISNPALAAPSAPVEQWGEFSLSLVERFGSLVLGTPDQGKSGAQQGSGLEARFMMPIGWGAYYRTNRSATNNQDNYDWSHFEFSAGFSRRLARGGSSNLVGARYELHADFGMLYSKLGTHGTCSRSWAPLNTTCDSAADHPVNLDGAFLGLEARVGVGLAFGPIGIGVDAGIAGFRRLVTGGNSNEPPGWFAAPTAQLKIGLDVPFL